MLKWHLTSLLLIYSQCLPLLVNSASALQPTCPYQLRVDPEVDSLDEMMGYSGSGDVQVFQDLQDALLMMESNEAGRECYDVQVAPGNYTLSRYFTVKTNIILHGSNLELAPVFVEFNVADYEPYVLLFQSIDFVKITGIKFQSSPGIIGFEDIIKVVIQNSTFRYCKHTLFRLA